MTWGQWTRQESRVLNKTSPPGERQIVKKNTDDQQVRFSFRNFKRWMADLRFRLIFKKWFLRCDLLPERYRLVPGVKLLHVSRPRCRSCQPHEELRQRTNAEPAGVLQSGVMDGQRQVWESAEELLKDDLHFDAGQLCPQAEVDPGAKCDVRVWRASNVHCRRCLRASPRRLAAERLIDQFAQTGGQVYGSNDADAACCALSARAAIRAKVGRYPRERRLSDNGHSTLRLPSWRSLSFLICMITEGDCNRDGNQRLAFLVETQPCEPLLA